MKDAKAGAPHASHAEATEAAAAVARKAGIAVTELSTPEQYREAHQLFLRVWRTDHQPVAVEMMRALSHAGAYVAGAFLDDRLVGAAVAFLTGPTDDDPLPHLHSHITGVDQTAQGRGVGLALKLHQRAWALGRGIDTVTWTYDPLVRRNAFFNLVKLGAHADRYLVDFYGPMGDGINAGQGSDRILIRWSLTSPRATAAAAGHGREADVADIPADAVVLRSDDAGWPRSSSASGSSALLCAVPKSIEQLRVADPALARAWRHGVRDALGNALGNGYEVAGATRSGWYVLEHVGGR